MNNCILQTVLTSIKEDISNIDIWSYSFTHDYDDMNFSYVLRATMDPNNGDAIPVLKVSVRTNDDKMNTGFKFGATSRLCFYFYDSEFMYKYMDQYKLDTNKLLEIGYSEESISTLKEIILVLNNSIKNINEF